MRRFIAILWLATISPAAADPAMLYTGIKLPPGFADGWSYSLQSRMECQMLINGVPLDAPARPMLKCIVKRSGPSKAPMS